MPTTCASATAGGKRNTTNATTLNSVANNAIQAGATASFACMVGWAGEPRGSYQS
jgi:hypothetical protein